MRLSHDVYFTLHDGSEAARTRLVAACHEYLTAHEGALSFGVGTPVREHDRPVNDREFDVALHLCFRDRAAHDAYQADARHQQFIAEQSAHWQRVRVFDSWVEDAPA